MSAHRTELFSDAVLAIALTLLVLDLSIRTFQASQLQGTLLHMWPTYVAFIAASSTCPSCGSTTTSPSLASTQWTGDI